MNLPNTFYAIDSPSTVDRDDAVGHDGNHLFVAIADVAIPDATIDDLLDRPETSYLPSRHIPMLGRSVEQSATLRPGPCPAFVLRIREDGTGADGTVCDLLHTDVNVETMTYQEAARWENADLLPLRDIALRQRLGRYDFDKRVAVIEGVERKLSQHECNEGFVLVMEMMVLANQGVARFMKQHGIPGLFRNHAEGDGQRAVYGLKPSGHAGLRLPLYTHATSPLRRLVDLLNWRQIRGHLQGQAYLNIGPMCERINGYYAALDEAEHEQRKKWALEVGARQTKRLDVQELARSKDFKNVLRGAPELTSKLQEAILLRAGDGLLSVKEAAMIMARRRWMAEELAQHNLDFVSIVQHATQTGEIPAPEVTFAQPRFVCTVKAGDVSAQGEGNSKIEAQQDASRKLLMAWAKKVD